MTRPEMLWRWNLLQAAGKGTQPGASRLPRILLLGKTETLFAEANAQDAIGVALAEMQMPDYTLEQKLRYEREILEVCVSGHPLDFFAHPIGGALNGIGDTIAQTQAERDGANVEMFHLSHAHGLQDFSLRVFHEGRC